MGGGVGWGRRVGGDEVLRRVQLAAERGAQTNNNQLPLAPPKPTGSSGSTNHITSQHTLIALMRAAWGPFTHSLHPGLLPSAAARAAAPAAANPLRSSSCCRSASSCSWTALTASGLRAW